MNDSARFNSQRAILEKYVKLFPNECWQEMLTTLDKYLIHIEGLLYKIEKADWNHDKVTDLLSREIGFTKELWNENIMINDEDVMSTLQFTLDNYELSSDKRKLIQDTIDEFFGPNDILGGDIYSQT